MDINIFWYILLLRVVNNISNKYLFILKIKLNIYGKGITPFINKNILKFIFSNFYKGAVAKIILKIDFLSL